MFIVNYPFKDMEPDSMMFMEGFTLQDAMCALEVTLFSIGKRKRSYKFRHR